MNIFGALLPCAYQRGCWGGDDHRMTDNRMGASVSSPHDCEPQPLGSTAQAARLSAPLRSSANNNDHIPAMARERKKLKVGGFATLRKKLVLRKRRCSKACDHARVIRDVVSDWSAAEVAALLDEYEALAALRDLAMQAELARPPAATFKQDLSTLYDFKYSTDADLVFRGACFPVHRALLSARCPYFRDLLAGCPGYGARICLELRTPGVDVEMFSALLRYLYTGDMSPGAGREGTLDMGLLRRLADEFGTPNPLEQDLRYLLETGDYADAALVFTSDYHRPDSGSSEYGFRPKLELPCHKAILSARSPFFRNLIQRRTRSGEEHTERALHIPTRIVLDESVIPKRYARVLLHAIYLDTVDLSIILRGSGCGSSAGSLGEVEALTHTGRTRPSPLEEAMELYQIGRFLELDIVSQGCEDLILEHLSLDSLAGVLRWGCEAHGSSWVHRQARHCLREEFAQLAVSPVLHQLDKAHLLDALASHFLQASELDVLQAVLKWGEHQLVRRMEDREPNLLSHTAHSVARKGVKKRDLSDVELREILSDLLPLVRMDHVAPTSSDALTQAIRRGLVSTPPSHMIGSDQRDSVRLNAWVRTSPHNNGLFVRPRLFMPYYEEIKSLLEDQLVQEVEVLRLRRARYLPDIPDTLYMVEEKLRPLGTAGLDVLVASIPVPDSVTMSAMLKREQKLRQSPSCQRAVALPLSSRHEINRQIRLRVVREFNLPDPVADLLENASCYWHDEDDEPSGKSGLGGSSGYHRSSSTLPRSAHANQHRSELPAIITEGDIYHMHPTQCRVQPESNSCSDGHLSDIMPDVAMATASLGQLALAEQLAVQEQLGLDLGDGGPPSHHPHSHHLPTTFRTRAAPSFSYLQHARPSPPIHPPPPHRFI